MPGSILKMAPDPKHGKPARTHLLTRERFGHFCLVEARPLTGRQHQIRTHLAAIGYPLAVDDLYGRRAELTGADYNAIVGRAAARPEELLLSRLPLHAAAISYRHPVSGEPMSQTAPLPPDLEAFLDLLRRTDRAP
jgi:23S rRNA pseudouridine1911/1915/1917 synthase